MKPTRLTIRRGLAAAQESIGVRVSFLISVFVAAMAAVLVAGGSLALATFLMPAVHELPDHAAVQTMQYTTLHVFPPALDIALVIAGAYMLGLVGIDYATRGRRLSPGLVTGAATYLIGVVAVTVFGMVPLEIGLLALDSSALPADAWIRHATAWSGFNNLRTVAAAASALAFVVAMVRR